MIVMLCSAMYAKSLRYWAAASVWLPRKRMRTQIADSIEYLKLLHTVVPVPRRRVRILRCEKSHIFIMTQAAYTDVEQTRHIPYGKQLFSLIPYPPIASVFHPAFFVITANAITQIITDRREPVAVASPMGNSVVGKSLEVR